MIGKLFWTTICQDIYSQSYISDVNFKCVQDILYTMTLDTTIYFRKFIRTDLKLKHK